MFNQQQHHRSHGPERIKRLRKLRISLKFLMVGAIVLSSVAIGMTVLISFQFENQTSNNKVQVSKVQNVQQSDQFFAKLSKSAENFSAFTSSCMLIMDDNHWLVEWLAYHWTVLNLRYMIIAIDQRSKTSPVVILDRWKGRIEYELWNDSHYFTIPHDAKNLQEINLARQQSFLSKCMQVFKARNHSWTMFTDTDEFIVVNRRARNKMHELYRRNVPNLAEPGSVLTFLNEEKSRGGNRCFSMGRLQFSPDEAPLEFVRRDVPAYLNASDFLTLRWLYAADDLVGPKNIVDLSSVEAELIPRHAAYQHRVIQEVCGEAGHTWHRKNSLLQVYHYLGTLEQFNYRDDARTHLKSAGRNRRYSRYRGKKIELADDLRAWIEAFEKKAGKDEVVRLLEGVGQTHGWPHARVHETKFAGPLNKESFDVDAISEDDDADTKGPRTFYSIARSDQSGAMLADMLLAHAYTYANNLEYGGACCQGETPHWLQAEELIRAIGLQDLLPFDCPRINVWNESFLDRSIYVKKGTKLFTSSYLKFLRQNIDRTLFPDVPESKTAVVHIRRGDVTPCSFYANRYLPNSHYIDILKKYVPSNLPVTILSESNAFEPFDDFANFTLKLDTSLIDAWRIIMTANYVVLSKSSFSMVPALLNDRNPIVIYTPFMHKKLNIWKTVSDNILKRTRGRLMQLINERCNKKERIVALRKIGG